MFSLWHQRPLILWISFDLCRVVVFLPQSRYDFCFCLQVWFLNLHIGFSSQFWKFISSFKMTDMVDLSFLSFVSVNLSFIFSTILPFFCYILKNTLRAIFHLFSPWLYLIWCFEFFISMIIFFLSKSSIYPLNLCGLSC